MKVVKIEYPTTLDKIEDLTDDNIDIFVTLDDGRNYTLVVSSLKNVGTLMNEQGYSEPGWAQQLIIVEKLDEELIKIAVEAYAEDCDGKYLKVSNLATEFEMEELDAALVRLDRIYSSDDD